MRRLNSLRVPRSRFSETATPPRCLQGVRPPRRRGHGRIRPPDGFGCVFTDAGTIRNLTYRGKLGDWVVSAPDGFFDMLCDMRAWGIDMFKQSFVAEGTVTWGGMADAPTKAALSFSMHLK